MEQKLKEIVSHFCIEGDFLGFEKNITGHINDSYRIKTSVKDHPGYFLQWINSYIFKDIEGLMNNISLVTNHLAEKLTDSKNLNFQVLEIIPCRDEKKFYFDPEGQYWRMYKFIDQMHGYDVVSDTKIAYEGGKAFGIFMQLLADLPADQLTETIPDFHNMEKRLEAFYISLDNNPANRVKEIEAEVNFVKQRAEQMLSIPALVNQGKLPRRITHNDTKFNNILFNSSEKAVCIVDLDTVMPGSILFDFGDAIRTAANTASEDEHDLDKVDINLPIYEAYTKGFMKSLQHTLSEIEINNIAFSARFMTFIIGIRFLTDYIDGDPYFRTLYPNHNLTRAKVQFKLIEKMESNAEKMHNIVIQSLELQQLNY